jgi:hypothetical protein
VLGAEVGVAHAGLDAGRADDLGDTGEIEVAVVDRAAFTLDAVKIL